MRLLIVILVGVVAMTLLNNVILGLTDPSLNDWISRLGYALFGAAIVGTMSSKR